MDERYKGLVTREVEHNGYTFTLVEPSRTCGVVLEEPKKDYKKLGEIALKAVKIFVSLLVVAGLAIAAFAGLHTLQKEFEAAEAEEREAVAELVTTLDNAYNDGYDIFLGGIKVGSIPDSVIEQYEMYTFTFDHIGGTVYIDKKPLE